MFETFHPSFLQMVLIIYYVLVLGAIFTIFLENKNPAKTVAYIIVMVALPVVGIVVYVLFGQDLRKKKLFSRKGIIDNDQITTWRDKYISEFEKSEELVHKELDDKIRVVKLLIKNEHTPLTTKNDLKLLNNGEETFPAIIEAINKAKHHIHLEYYIYTEDSIGDRIKELLINKSQQGVRVRFIYDYVGSRLSRAFVKELEAGGIEVFSFMPVFFPRLTSKVNYRNHRKIVVVDGKVGFLGGVNIDDRYDNTLENDMYWRDMHLMLEGEAVKSMQLLFFLNWRFVSSQLLSIDEDYFPKISLKSHCPVQIVGSGPDSDWASIMQATFLEMMTADERICIITPYFIPNESILTALQTAALSGIDVQIVLPAKADSRIVQAAGMSYVRPLLEAGVKVYLYKKGFIHSKIIIVDDEMASIGTANMDYRSYEINFEVNAVIYDKSATKELLKNFELDKANSERLFLHTWEKRNFSAKVGESLARLVAPLL